MLISCRFFLCPFDKFFFTRAVSIKIEPALNHITFKKQSFNEVAKPLLFLLFALQCRHAPMKCLGHFRTIFFQKCPNNILSYFQHRLTKQIKIFTFTKIKKVPKGTFFNTIRMEFFMFSLESSTHTKFKASVNIFAVHIVCEWVTIGKA